MPRPRQQSNIPRVGITPAAQEGSGISSARLPRGIRAANDFAPLSNIALLFARDAGSRRAEVEQQEGQAEAIADLSQQKYETLEENFTRSGAKLNDSLRKAGEDTRRYAPYNRTGSILQAEKASQIFDASLQERVNEIISSSFSEDSLQLKTEEDVAGEFDKAFAEVLADVKERGGKILQEPGGGLAFEAHLAQVAGSGKAKFLERFRDVRDEYVLETMTNTAASKFIQGQDAKGINDFFRKHIWGGTGYTATRREKVLSEFVGNVINHYSSLTEEVDGITIPNTAEGIAKLTDLQQNLKNGRAKIKAGDEIYTQLERAISNLDIAADNRHLQLQQIKEARRTADLFEVRSAAAQVFRQYEDENLSASELEDLVHAQIKQSEEFQEVDSSRLSVALEEGSERVTAYIRSRNTRQLSEQQDERRANQRFQTDWLERYDSAFSTEDRTALMRELSGKEWGSDVEAASWAVRMSQSLTSGVWSEVSNNPQVTALENSMKKEEESALFEGSPAAQELYQSFLDRRGTLKADAVENFSSETSIALGESASKMQAEFEAGMREIKLQQKAVENKMDQAFNSWQDVELSDEEERFASPVKIKAMEKDVRDRNAKLSNVRVQFEKEINDGLSNAFLKTGEGPGLFQALHGAIPLGEGAEAYKRNVQLLDAALQEVRAQLPGMIEAEKVQGATPETIFANLYSKVEDLVRSTVVGGGEEGGELEESTESLQETAEAITDVESFNEILESEIASPEIAADFLRINLSDLDRSDLSEFYKVAEGRGLYAEEADLDRFQAERALADPDNASKYAVLGVVSREEAATGQKTLTEPISFESVLDQTFLNAAKKYGGTSKQLRNRLYVQSSQALSSNAIREGLPEHMRSFWDQALEDHKSFKRDTFTVDISETLKAVTPIDFSSEGETSSAFLSRMGAMLKTKALRDGDYQKFLDFMQTTYGLEAVNDTVVESYIQLQSRLNELFHVD